MWWGITEAHLQQDLNFSSTVAEVVLDIALTVPLAQRLELWHLLVANLQQASAKLTSRLRHTCWKQMSYRIRGSTEVGVLHDAVHIA
jgi:hypothetical protein